MSQNIQPRDSQWLQLDVCRDFLVGKCGKLGDCQFAHPMTHTDVVDHKVMACYDSFKGRCRRISPPCKYYHPTPPLMEVLIQRGKNHVAMKQQLEVTKVEVGSKRSADVASSGEVPIDLSGLYFKRPNLATAGIQVPMIPVPFIPQPVYQPPIPLVPTDREY